MEVNVANGSKQLQAGVSLGEGATAKVNHISTGAKDVGIS